MPQKKNEKCTGLTWFENTLKGDDQEENINKTGLMITKIQPREQ